MFDISFATFNILNDHHAIKYKTPPGYIEIQGKKGVEIRGNWDERKNLILQQILNSNCDVICLQEVSWDAFNFFQENFKNTKYKIAGYSQHAAYDCKAPSSHGNMILFNHQKLTLLHNRIYFSLKEKFQENANGLKVSLARGEIISIFSYDLLNITFSVSNTHLKGYDRFHAIPEKEDEESLPGYEQLVEIIHEIEAPNNLADFFVLAGDLNEGFEKLNSKFSRLKYLAEKNFITDGNMEPSEPLTNTKIDHIYFKRVNSNLQKFSLIPLQLTINSKPGSDHCLIATKLEIDKANHLSHSI